MKITYFLLETLCIIFTLYLAFRIYKKFKKAKQEWLKDYAFLTTILFGFPIYMFIRLYLYSFIMLFLVNMGIFEVALGEDLFNSILRILPIMIGSSIFGTILIIATPYLKSHKLFYITILYMILFFIFGVIFIGLFKVNILRNIGILFSTIFFSLPIGIYYLRKLYHKEKS